MAEELSYFNDVVWEATEKSAAQTTKDFKLIRTRWVVCNKADAEAPDIRARLVACEVDDKESDA